MFSQVIHNLFYSFMTIRFTDCGWQGVKAWTMNDVYASIAPKEIERIESIEMLDEHELLKQLFDHYCIVIAYNDAMTLSIDSVELKEFEWLIIEI